MASTARDTIHHMRQTKLSETQILRFFILRKKSGAASGDLFLIPPDFCIFTWDRTSLAKVVLFSQIDCELVGRHHEAFGELKNSRDCDYVEY